MRIRCLQSRHLLTAGSRWLSAIYLLPMLATLAYADPPSVEYFFPAGGQGGTTVKFRIGGYYLHEGSAFEMRGTGIEPPKRIQRTETIWFEGPVIFQSVFQRGENYPKYFLGTVKISADAPLGERHWRIWNSQGITPFRRFIVGDLPEIVEEEIDGRAVSVKVTVPVTVNGRIFPREDVDIWTIEAQAGQTFTCEVRAARLGSPLDSRLEVRGPAHR